MNVGKRPKISQPNEEIPTVTFSLYNLQNYRAYHHFWMEDTFPGIKVMGLKTIVYWHIGSGHVSCIKPIVSAWVWENDPIDWRVNGKPTVSVKGNKVYTKVGFYISGESIWGKEIHKHHTKITIYGTTASEAHWITGTSRWLWPGVTWSGAYKT